MSALTGTQRRITYTWLAHWGAAGAFHSTTPTTLYKGDGTATPISCNATELFVGGAKVALQSDVLAVHAIAEAASDSASYAMSIAWGAENMANTIWSTPFTAGDGIEISGGWGSLWTITVKMNDVLSAIENSSLSITGSLAANGGIAFHGGGYIYGSLDLYGQVTFDNHIQDSSSSNWFINGAVFSWGYWTFNGITFFNNEVEFSLPPSVESPATEDTHLIRRIDGDQRYGGERRLFRLDAIHNSDGTPRNTDLIVNRDMLGIPSNTTAAISYEVKMWVGRSAYPQFFGHFAVGLRTNTPAFYNGAFRTITLQEWNASISLVQIGPAGAPSRISWGDNQNITIRVQTNLGYANSESPSPIYIEFLRLPTLP